jgi:hypothetical protein
MPPDAGLGASERSHPIRMISVPSQGFGGWTLLRTGTERPLRKVYVVRTPGRRGLGAASQHGSEKNDCGKGSKKRSHHGSVLSFGPHVGGAFGDYSIEPSDKFQPGLRNPKALGLRVLWVQAQRLVPLLLGLGRVVEGEPFGGERGVRGSEVLRRSVAE